MRIVIGILIGLVLGGAAMAQRETIPCEEREAFIMIKYNLLFDHVKKSRDAGDKVMDLMKVPHPSLNKK